MSVRERFEDATVLALQMERGTMSQGMQVVSRICEGLLFPIPLSLLKLRACLSALFLLPAHHFLKVMHHCGLGLSLFDDVPTIFT